MEIKKVQLPPSTGLPEVPKVPKGEPTVTQRPESFAKALLEEMFSQFVGIKLSKHAAERILQRGISLSKQDFERLRDGVEKAAKKGARSALLVMLPEKFGFIVSLTNKTVITVVDDTRFKDGFTNIDATFFI